MGDEIKPIDFDKLDRQIFSAIGYKSRQHFSTFHQPGGKYYFKIPGQKGCFDLADLFRLNPNTYVSLFAPDGRWIGNMPVSSVKYNFKLGDK
jgi:hypothetical protein